MLDLIRTLGADRCLVCDAAPTLRSTSALNGSLCRQCAASVPEALIPLASLPEGLTAGWHLGPYAGPIGSMVRAGKYLGNEEILRALGRYCGAVGPWGAEVDAVVPVPSSAWKRAIRGMNPPDLIAMPVAARLGVPVRHPLVRRHGTAQARVQRAEREENVRGAFRAVAPVRGRILLVDDVLTTGATARACANELLSEGAQEVCLLVLAASSAGVLVS